MRPSHSQGQGIFSPSGRKPSALPPPSRPRPAPSNHSPTGLSAVHISHQRCLLCLAPFTWHNVARARHVVACVRTHSSPVHGQATFGLSIHPPGLFPPLGCCEQRCHANMPGQGLCRDMYVFSFLVRSLIMSYWLSELCYLTSHSSRSGLSRS